MNPEIDADSHGSPMDQAYHQHQQLQNENNNTLNSVSGKVVNMKGGGRTLNIPVKFDTENTIPGNTFNGGISIGETCIGSHCYIPIDFSTYSKYSIGTDRLGNNSMTIPTHQYGGKKLNNYSYIIHPKYKTYHYIQSKTGKHILKKYIKNSLNI
jgi:hypothetical protein